MYEEAVRTESRSQKQVNRSQLRTRNRDSIFDAELEYTDPAKVSKGRRYLGEFVDPCKTVAHDGTKYLNIDNPAKVKSAVMSHTAEMSAAREQAGTQSIPRGRAMTREEAVRIRNAKASFPIAAVTLTIICTLLAMVMVYSFTKTYETSAEISDLQENVQKLRAENEELSLQLEEKDNLALIEDLARNEYGMVGEEELPKRYVSLSASDYIEPQQIEDTTPGVFATILSAIGINFGNLGE